MYLVYLCTLGVPISECPKMRNSMLTPATKNLRRYVPRLWSFDIPSLLRLIFHQTKCFKKKNIYRFDRWTAAALIDVVDAERSWALVMASDTGLWGGGAGVVERDGAALRLCVICAFTR